MFGIMWCYKVVFIVAVISAANAKNIQEDGLARNVARNRQITYYFYFGPGAPAEVLSGDGPPSNFDSTIPVVVLIHDRRGYYQDEFSNAVRSAIYTNEFQCNLFVMDWSYLADNSYADVVQNLDAAAEDLVLFIEGILPPGEDFENVRLVGFGIGAHLAGNAGYRLRRTPIGQIVGLDPPGRSFSSVNSKRLTADDALHVEVFHTNGGIFGNGIGFAIGRVDFFVNGGSNQPGCHSSSCNHDYAYALYVSSLNFPQSGAKCNTMTQVSLNTCRGRSMILGGLVDKTIIDGYYRINTPRNLPRLITKE